MQSLLPPDPMDPFDVYGWQVALHQGMRATIAIARVSACDGVQAGGQLLVLQPTDTSWPIAQTGAADVAERATTPEGQPARMELLDGIPA